MEFPHPTTSQTKTVNSVLPMVQKEELIFLTTMLEVFIMLHCK